MNNIKNVKTLLIIPAYNEEKSILHTCQTIWNYNKNHNAKLSIIVINDGSDDQTKNICEENNIPHLNLCLNSGIGNAVQTGYMYAKINNYDIAIQFDGDGQHDISYVNNIIEAVTNNEGDLIIGSRFINENISKFKSSGARRAGIKIISFFIKMLTKQKIYDTTSGYRAVNRKLINFFSENYPSEYPEPVSIISAIKKEYTEKEIPVNMIERKEGKSSIHTWKNIYYMINVVLSVIIEAMGGYKNEY